MKIEFDLDETVSKALQSALSPERIFEKIETEIKKTVDAAITENFRSYGDFGKMVSQAVGEIVPHSIDMSGQSAFSDSLLQIVRERLSIYRDEALIKQLDETVSSLLEKPPVQVNLSMIIGEAIKAWSDSYHRDTSDSPTVIVEETTGLCAGYVHVYLDPKSGKSKYSCQCQIDITSEGKVYGLKADGENIGKSLFVGNLHHFDRYLFWLYTGATKIIIDQTDFSDVYYSEEHED